MDETQAAVSTLPGARNSSVAQCGRAQRPKKHDDPIGLFRCLLQGLRSGAERAASSTYIAGMT